MSIRTDPQKTILNGVEYEFVPAEVVEVDYQGTNKSRLYTITCKILGAIGSVSGGDLVHARAMDANIKNIPIAGEIVMITKAPSANSNAFIPNKEYYYTHPISIHSSVHHNGLPGSGAIPATTLTKDERVRSDSESGIPHNSYEDVSFGNTIDLTFPERLDVFPLQPYSGDILIEGRWGQSIRFGSTVEETMLDYPVKPKWKKGLGDTGNPIIIISNGTNPDYNNTRYNEFIIEDIDNDDSSIWLTSGQYVRFTQASMFTKAISNKNVDLFKANNYSGNQVLIASDRIILNSKKQEIIAFAKEGIGLSSEKAIAIDGASGIEMEGARINLGVNAVEPAILGDTAVAWLTDLCSALNDALREITLLTVPTGVGPSLTPINSAAFSAISSRISGLSSRLEELKSQLVFLNKKPTK
jgi:RNA binding exosome subunit